MLTADEKRIAFAAMDDAASFRLLVAPAPPAGEHAVAITRADDVDALRAAVTLTRQMARTFFADKLRGLSPPPTEAGPVALFVVAQR